jgi:competence protein ComEA
MHDAEARALKRAVVILLLVSSARWAWARAEPAAGAAGTDVREQLLQESRVAADEERARSEPLADGERIDPNRADEVQLDRLPGVGVATAEAIVRAREEGVVFRRPDDLTRVRGIGPATVERLEGLLDLDRPPARVVGTPGVVRAAPSALGVGRAAAVDVNRAGPDELQALPGIGPALAERILTERRKRMFTSVDDLLRVPGIGPATLERLRGRVQVSGGF